MNQVTVTVTGFNSPGIGIVIVAPRMVLEGIWQDWSGGVVSFWIGSSDGLR